MFNKKLLGGGIPTEAFSAQDHFDVIGYVGDDYVQEVGYTNFKPDIVIMKNRNSTDDVVMVNSLRPEKYLYMTDDNAEGTEPPVTSGSTTRRFWSYDDNGFTVGESNETNENYFPMIAWCWKLADASVTNTDGDITSTVKANPDTNMSMVIWTGGTGTATNDTIGHGLSETPVVEFRRNLTSNFQDMYVLTTIYDGSFDEFPVNDTGGGKQDIHNDFNAPDSSFIYRGNNGHLGSSTDTYMSWCMAEKEGFSKFGNYTGNGGSQEITGLGFKPAMIMIRGQSNDPWLVFDDVRGPDYRVEIYDPTSEKISTTLTVTFTSDGFITGDTADYDLNRSNFKYIYLAFARDTSIKPLVDKSFNAQGLGNPYGTNVDTEHIITGFRAGLVWAKNLTSITDWRVYDTLRGRFNTSYALPSLELNKTTAAANELYGVVGFGEKDYEIKIGSTEVYDSDGVVYYSWKGGDYQYLNTQGSLDSMVSASPNSGFSIVKHTNSGSKSDTIGHGLSAAPEILITKKYQTTSSWWVYTTLIDGSYDYIQLNGTGAKNNSSGLGSPTSTVFYNESGTVDNQPYITYCFHSVEGYSDLGTYTGNGSSTGPIITTGFEPSFVMIKRTNSTGQWLIADNVQTGESSVKTSYLKANDDDGAITYTWIEFLSNGFQLKNTGSSLNSNGSTYLYMAFKMNEPTLAKSFGMADWDGNSGAQNIQTLGFRPHLSFMKEYTTRAYRDWAIVDTRFPWSSGNIKLFSTNTTDSADVFATNLQIKPIDSGWNLEGTSDGYLNQTGYSYISFNWKANDVRVINEEGTIDSEVSVNQAAGFSMVHFTGDGSSSATVGHGLDGTPDFVIYPGTFRETHDTYVVHKDMSTGSYVLLNGAAAQTSSAGTDGKVSYNTFTSTTLGFTAGTSNVNNVNQSSKDIVAYCWRAISGYSAFGSYTGNGSSTGPTITLDFAPDMILIRCITTGRNWRLCLKYFDTTNPISDQIFPNLDYEMITSTGGTGYDIDFNTDGFQIKTSNVHVNANGSTYIYAAWKAN